MQKTLLSLALTAILTCTANASPIPFIDHAKFTVKSSKIINKLKRASIENYVNSNELDLSDGGVEDSDIPRIITYLQNHPAINALNLANNFDLTSGAMAKLATVTTLTALNLARDFKDCENNICTGGLEGKDTLAFANNTSLTYLNLYNNSIGDEGAINIAKNPHLTILDVSANNISDLGGQALAQNKLLEELDLGENEGITSKTALALSENTALHHLELQQTKVDDEGAIALASKLRLDYLALGEDNITDKSAQAFADNTTIEDLDLAGTKMTADGAVILSKNTVIDKLDFSGDFFGSPRANDIGDKGAIALAQMKNLSQLYLSSQQVTKLGAEALGKTHLYDLDLSANYDLGDAGAAELANINWVSLDLSACSLSDKGAESLAKTDFLYLFAQANFISDAGVTALSNRVYAVLDLTENEIRDEGAFALAKSGAMQALLVSYNRISVIGVAALVHSHIPYLEIGEQAPLSAQLHKSVRVHAKRKFCYRETNKLRCVSKDAVVLPAQKKLR